MNLIEKKKKGKKRVPSKLLLKRIVSEMKYN